VALEVGLQAALVHEISEDDTATAMGSGDVDVLATPRLIALAEAACVAALGDADLAKATTTVGTRIEFDHVIPLPVGDAVVVSARLVEVDARALRFEVVATDDGDRVIGRGFFGRMLVDRSRFLARTQDR
jgi:predicted thioesterase